MNSHREQYSEEDIRLIDAVAEKVVRRQMAEPVLLFLESVQPLNYVGSQAILFLEPFLAFAFDATQVERFRGLLERRETIEVLIERIERAVGKTTP